MKFLLLSYLNLFIEMYTNHQLAQNVMNQYEFINYFTSGVLSNFKTFNLIIKNLDLQTNQDIL